MARKRMIDPKFWSDDKMMALTPMHRLLFIGIWNFSDDYGIHKNNDSTLKAEVFPCDPITVKEVGQLKDDLIKNNLIVPFTDQDTELFFIKNWNEYQKINRPQPSKYQFTERTLNDHGTFTPNRIEKNKTEKKVVEVATATTSSNLPFDLKALQGEYPKVDVEFSFDKYQSYCQTKGNDVEFTGFQNWVKKDAREGWNERKNVESTMTLYCSQEDCDGQVRCKGDQAWKHKVCKKCGNMNVDKWGI